eukprot:5713104-Amphidinium_carterae.2
MAAGAKSMRFNCLPPGSLLCLSRLLLRQNRALTHAIAAPRPRESQSQQAPLSAIVTTSCTGFLEERRSTSWEDSRHQQPCELIQEAQLPSKTSKQHAAAGQLDSVDCCPLDVVGAKLIAAKRFFGDGRVFPIHSKILVVWPEGLKSECARRRRPLPQPLHAKNQGRVGTSNSLRTLSQLSASDWC